MPERNRTLRNILKIQGLTTIAIGIGWLVVPSRGRLNGVLWLEDILAWVPFFTVDVKVGIGWIISGVLMLLAGWFGRKSKSLENAGFVAALCWPLGMALVYFFAAGTGYAPNGALNAISYLNFAAPYVGFMLWPPRNWKSAHPVTAEVARTHKEAEDAG